MTYVTNSKYWKLIKRGWKIQVWAWTKEISSKQMWNCPASHGADYGGYLYFKNMFSPRVLSQGKELILFSLKPDRHPDRKKRKMKDMMRCQLMFKSWCSSYIQILSMLHRLRRFSQTQLRKLRKLQALRAWQRVDEGGDCWKSRWFSWLDAIFPLCKGFSEATPVRPLKSHELPRFYQDPQYPLMIHKWFHGGNDVMTSRDGLDSKCLDLVRQIRLPERFLISRWP